MVIISGSNNDPDNHVERKPRHLGLFSAGTMCVPVVCFFPYFLQNSLHMLICKHIHFFIQDLGLGCWVLIGHKKCLLIDGHLSTNLGWFHWPGHCRCPDIFYLSPQRPKRVAADTSCGIGRLKERGNLAKGGNEFWCTKTKTMVDVDSMAAIPPPPP